VSGRGRRVWRSLWRRHLRNPVSRVINDAGQTYGLGDRSEEGPAERSFIPVESKKLWGGARYVDVHPRVQDGGLFHYRKVDLLT